MGTRKEYTDCMRPWMTGGGPDRKERFCIGSKICSSKASNEQEAAKLCAEAAANPKPPKAKKTRGGKLDTGALAVCVINALNGSEPTLSNLQAIIAGCTGQKAGAAPPGREKFIKNCFKEHGFTGDPREGQKLRTLCATAYKAQQEGS